MLDLDKYFTIESLQRDKGESANKECNHSLETTCGKKSGSAISLSVKLRVTPAVNPVELNLGDFSYAA